MNPKPADPTAAQPTLQAAQVACLIDALDPVAQDHAFALIFGRIIADPERLCRIAALWQKLKGERVIRRKDRER